MDPPLIRKVAEIYRWLDEQTAPYAGLCKACGKCCDFDRFDHRLCVTSPELIYFRYKIGPENIKPAVNGRCPYNTDGKCSVYQDRFAGCRIFCCAADKDTQSGLSESIARKFARVCADFDVPYCYIDLTAALT